MKAITLWQPWASLVAEGVKTIETRSWATKYRGPLAIHAAARQPENALRLGEWIAYAGSRDPFREPSMFVNASGTRLTYLPLGAVVATCNLVDVVPIGPVDAMREDGELLWTTNVDGLTLHNFTTGRGRNVEGQRPFGDFTPGRYAWLLDNIVKLDEPVTAKGKQQLWSWERAA